MNAKLKAIGPLLVVVGIGAGAYWINRQHDAEAQCFSIYEDVLPKGAEISDIEGEGQRFSIRYTSPAGSGEIQCARTADGELDDVATMNLKIEHLWGPEDAEKE